MFLLSGQSYRRLIRLEFTEIIRKLQWRVSRKLKILLFHISKTKSVKVANTNKEKRISFVNERFLDPQVNSLSQNVLKEADDIFDGYFYIHDFGRVQWKSDTIPWCKWKPDVVRSFHRHDFLITLLRASRYSHSDKYITMIEILREKLFSSYSISMMIKYDKAIDIAIRFLNWSATYNILKKDRFTKKELEFWFKQIKWMRANMSPGGNHRLLESLCLFAAGIFFGEIDGSKKWRVEGESIVLKEMQKQVSDDGVHAEQSMYYQLIAATHFLKFIILCDKKAIKLPRNFIERFFRMLEYIWVAQKPDGVHPMIGDGDELTSEEREHWESRALIPFYLMMNDVSGYGNESLEWFCQIVPGYFKIISNVETKKSQVFEKGGHAILKDEAGNYLFFNCGHFGYKPYPHHGHADALSTEICLNGKTVIMDAGGYAYRKDIYRHFARSTVAHNTIELDSSDQSEIYGVFGVGRTADVYIDNYNFSCEIDVVEGYHNGYYPIIHKRKILFLKNPIRTFIIYDEVQGEGVHECRLLYHIAPEVKVARKEQHFIKFYHQMKPIGNAFIFSDRKQSIEIYKGDGIHDIQGMISKRTGKIIFSDVVRVNSTNRLPVKFLSVFSPEDDLQIDAQAFDRENIVLKTKKYEHKINLHKAREAKK